MMSRRDKHGRTRAGSGQQRVRFWKTKQFKWSMLTLLVVVVATIGVYAYLFGNFISNIQQGNKGNGDTLVEVEEWSGKDRVNILLLGVDNRDNDTHPRADTMLIVSIDPVTKKANAMSVMRDTWYKIPDGYDFEKINAAHALGGPDLTIRTLKDMLQIPIHYYAKTDFQGFIKIIDAIGGITIDVEKPLHYLDDGVYDIHLNEGLQKLDGTHALMYVRFRNDALGDFARTERQRKFLAALADEMSSASTLLKLPSLLDAIEPFIETNMTMSDMVKLGRLALEVDGSDIQTLQIPPRDALREGYAGGGQAVLIPNVYETRRQVYEFLGMDTSLVEEDQAVQPQEYYAKEPVVPVNPKVDPVQPKPDPEKAQKPEADKPEDGTEADGTKPTDGTKPPTGTTPGQPSDGTTTPPTGGTTTPPAGGGGQTTPTTPPTSGTTTPPTGGATTPPSGGTGGTTTPPAGGGTTTPPTGGSGDTTTPSTGGTTTPPATTTTTQQ